jgi:polar amino acid transport system substrate-binding protein
MRKRRFTMIYAAGALLLATTLSACGGDDGGNGGGGGDSLDLINEGTLTVCSDIPYPPFEMESGGDYTGFDMDLMKEIAAGLDLELSVQDSSFDGLQSGLSLNSSQCDIVASAMTITEEREENIDFTEPYYDSKQSLLVPVGSDIASIDDLAGKKVGVQQGTTGKTYTEENAPDADIISFPSDGEMYPAIQAGQVDALLQDLPVNLSHTEDGKFEIVEEYETDEQYGFAVREEGSEALLEAVNGQLQELRDSGRYQEIYDSYFATD